MYYVWLFEDCLESMVGYDSEVEFFLLWLIFKLVMNLVDYFVLMGKFYNFWIGIYFSEFVEMVVCVYGE